SPKPWGTIFRIVLKLNSWPKGQCPVRLRGRCCLPVGVWAPPLRFALPVCQGDFWVVTKGNAARRFHDCQAGCLRAMWHEGASKVPGLTAPLSGRVELIVQTKCALLALNGSHCPKADTHRGARGRHLQRSKQIKAVEVAPVLPGHGNLQRGVATSPPPPDSARCV